MSNPFKETLKTKEELYKDFKLIAQQKRALGQNALLAHYGLFHGAAIKDFCGGQVDDLMNYGGIPLTSKAYFQAGLNAWENLANGLTSLPDFSVRGIRRSNNLGFALQRIFYGAPGTGKSHEIKEQTKGLSVIRTTFHPDSDYSTFVGSYKPTMDDVETQVVPVVVNKGISLQNDGVYKEKRIVYKFIMQAFMKAYLGAWKKYSDAGQPGSSSLVFSASGARYTITGIDSNGVSHNKRFQFPITVGRISGAWNEIWKSGSFVMPSDRRPGRSLEEAVSQWIYDHVDGCTKDSLETGIETLKKSVHEVGPVVVSRSQKYTISAGDSEDSYYVTVDSLNSKSTLKDYYSGTKDIEDATEIRRKIVEKLWDYDADSFENAWDKLTSAVNSAGSSGPVIEPQFLIIEEINRGNCAQIFGDLFQLLDRSNNGFSEYPIEADADLQKEIENAFNGPGDYKLDKDIDVEGAVEEYFSNYGATLSEDIKRGRVLLLPPNLYIWATMNTSDQSLFPIDSAFKRRWDWKYMKIKNEHRNWKIDVERKVKDQDGNDSMERFDWWCFIERINSIIASMTSSADKQLGYFFCKADKKENDNDEFCTIISQETFVSKVIFYLWNDVFKDYGFDDASLFQFKEQIDGKEVSKELTFPDFYDETGKNVNSERLKGFLESVMTWTKKGEESN